MSAIKLSSKDDQIFETTKTIAETSITLKNMIEDSPDLGGEVPVPLPNVTGAVLKKVLDYCKYHHENPPKEDDKLDADDIGEWDRDFLKVDQELLFDLILAANYLDIKPLLDVTCKTVAAQLRGKTPEEIRKMYDIQGDFTPEEEEKARKEHDWE